MSKELSSFLTTTPSDTPDAKNLTSGIYDFLVQGSRVDQVGEDNKDKITIFAKPVGVVDGNFPPSELAFANRVRMDYFGTIKALAASSPVISLKQFLKTVLELNDETAGSMTYSALLEMAIGRPFRAEVREEMAGKNKDIPVASIVRLVRQA